MSEAADQGERLDLRQALTIARRRWWLVALCVVLVGGAAYVFSASQQKQYTATASLLLRDAGLEQALLATAVSAPTVDPTREAETNIEVVSSPAVAARTAAALHVPPAVVTDEVSAAAVGQTNVVAVNVTDPSPENAARLANTYARQAVAFSQTTDRSQILETQAAIQGQLKVMSSAQRKSAYGQLLESRDQELQLIAISDTGGAQVISYARPPSSPSSPKTKRNVVLGLLLGLVLGLGTVAFVERWNRRIRSSTELVGLHELPVLSEVPQSRAMARSGNGFVLDEGEREAFRVILAKLQYAHAGEEVKSVLVTSATAQEGKSTVAWHLAETLASRGRDRVLLIETDLRKPVLASRHHLNPGPGLSDILERGVSVRKAIQTVKPHVTSSSDAGSMDVIVAGPTATDPIRLLEGPVMGNLLQQAGERYDFVIVDTVPALLTADAMPLVGKVGGVLLVSRVGVTTRDQAHMLKEELSALNAPVVGVVANAVAPGQGRYTYYGQRKRNGANGSSILRWPQA